MFAAMRLATAAPYAPGRAHLRNRHISAGEAQTVRDLVGGIRDHSVQSLIDVRRVRDLLDTADRITIQTRPALLQTCQLRGVRAPDADALLMTNGELNSADKALESASLSLYAMKNDARRAYELLDRIARKRGDSADLQPGKPMRLTITPLDDDLGMAGLIKRDWVFKLRGKLDAVEQGADKTTIELVKALDALPPSGSSLEPDGGIERAAQILGTIELTAGEMWADVGNVHSGLLTSRFVLKNLKVPSEIIDARSDADYASYALRKISGIRRIRQDLRSMSAGEVVRGIVLLPLLPIVLTVGWLYKMVARRDGGIIDVVAIGAATYLVVAFIGGAVVAYLVFGR